METTTQTRYTVRETADLLGITIAKLRWHIYQRRDLVPEKTGNMLFFTDGDIANIRVMLAARQARLDENRRKREAQRRPRATRMAAQQDSAAAAM